MFAEFADAIQTTQAEALQGRLSGEGRRERKDRRAASDSHHAVAGNAPGEGPQA